VRRANTCYEYVQKCAYHDDDGKLESWGLIRIVAQRNCHGLDVLLAAALLVLVPGLAAAQGSVARPVYAAQVDESTVTALRGNLHPLARAQYDQGKVDPSFQARAYYDNVPANGGAAGGP